MGRIGPTEILIIVAIALLLFGGRRIAEIGKGLGEGIKNFKKGINDPPKEEPEALPPGTTGTTPTATASRPNESATTGKSG